MIRAVLDPGVLVAGMISSAGAPATILRVWLEGTVELVVCPASLAELRRALGYPKIRSRVSAEEATSVLDLLGDAAAVLADPDDPPAICRDPDDDYLFALAEEAGAVLVSGDRDVLSLPHPPIRVVSPRAFASLVARLSSD